jgi:hypothetical protein
MKIQTSKEPGRERDVTINGKLYSFPRVWMAWYQDTGGDWTPCGIYTGYDERAAVDYAKDDYAITDHSAERHWQAIEIPLPYPAKIIRKQLRLIQQEGANDGEENNAPKN